MRHPYLLHPAQRYFPRSVLQFARREDEVVALEFHALSHVPSAEDPLHDWGPNLGSVSTKSFEGR